MNWLLTVLFCAVLVEIVLKLPFLRPLEAILTSSRRAAHVVKAKVVSDHWKEKAMRAYAQRTFVASLKLAGLLALVLGGAALLLLALDRLSDGFQAFVLSWIGLASSVAAASLYIMARKALAAAGSHG